MTAYFATASSDAGIALPMESFENSSGGIGGFTGFDIWFFAGKLCDPCFTTDGDKSIEWEREITITFDNPINAFGIDIIGIGSIGPIDLKLTSDNGSQILCTNYQGVEDNVIFSGLIDTDAQFNSVTFSHANSYDIAWADRMQRGVITSVPTPAAVWLFGSGLIGLILKSYKRRHPLIKK